MQSGQQTRSVATATDPPTDCPVRPPADPASEHLLAVLYNELRQVAGACLARERHNHTLQPTALVHEAYLRLTGGKVLDTHNRAQFFALVAKVMRQVLVDHGKARRANKRGGSRLRLSHEHLLSLYDESAVDLLALDEAMRELDRLDPQQARIVELRFFGGLTVPETADALAVSVSTVEREWRLAKAWLKTRLPAP